ncbi:MAG: phytanoyl-CoA dioxygenase family protein [Deltaproteobacteria bacterium]|nr:phytanoyl-CoA dioxygenase family protein [Deltaproteobacteria bacterium]MBW2394973.1 phytanoyl-CoA dioxygenase family protein [Deltaproteobacteria bacterium]
MTDGFPSLDFDRFHREELPKRLAKLGAMGAKAAAVARPKGSLAFRMPDGRAWTYSPVESGFEFTPGDADAKTIVGLEPEAWEGLVHDFESAPGLLYGGRVRSERGNLMRFVGWEPALRALYQGLPIYDPAHPDLRDASGRPVDPARSFRLDGDSEEDMHAFLEAAGYLLIKAVFDAGEVAALRTGADALRGRAREGDQRSWWGRNGKGDSVLCRVLDAAALPEFRGLPSDPRLKRIAAISGRDLVSRKAQKDSGVTVLWKNPDMVEGLSDLPWHRDCGMGGHALMCPSMVMSIYLEAATPESGELRFLPGSWRCTFGFAESNDRSAPRGVGVAAEPGDVSIHYGDGMHAAPPPTSREGPFRTSVLLGFAPPEFRPHGGVRHYNDVLLGREDGQIEHLTKVVAETGRAKKA